MGLISMQTILNPTWILAITVVILAFIYNFIIKNWWYFTVRNVKFYRGLPILGCIDQMILGKESFAMTIHRLYNKFPTERFFGIFELTQPVFIVRDPELIREITVQQFEHFTNHQGDIIDPLLGRGLFFLKNQKWKDMRGVLSPAFTGNKMRSMFELIHKSTGAFIKQLSTKLATDGNVIELKDTFTRHTSDVIATCAFGLDVNSMQDRDNEFYQTGKKITNFDGIQGVKLLLFDCIPAIMRLFNINLFESKIAAYFRTVVKSTIEYREKNKIFRPDLISLLMKARQAAKQSDAIGVTEGKKSAIEWHDDDLVAQCLIFFFAGFETVSTLLCFLSHELALNPNIQQRVYDEIIGMEKTGATDDSRLLLSYEDLPKLPYLDMVIMETLRRWPPIPSTDRQVTKPFILDNQNGVQIPLTKDDSIWIPIFGLHMNPEYFPNPHVFNPERFSEQNRDRIIPGTYLPFGNGQRQCIASRFAIMEVKIIFFYLLKSFAIERCEKTADPLILKSNTINMMADNGFWVKFVPRQQNV